MLVTTWGVVLYGMTVLAAMVVFGYDEVRHNTKPDSLREWLSRAGALTVISALWPLVLLAGWRGKRVVPPTPREPVELKVIAGTRRTENSLPLHSWILPEDLVGLKARVVVTPDEWAQTEEWGPVQYDPADPQQRPFQKKPCGCARDGFLREYAHCADHNPKPGDSVFRIGPGTLVPREPDEDPQAAITRFLAERQQNVTPMHLLRYSGDLGEWVDLCGCTWTDESREQAVSFCRKHGPGLPRCECRWDSRVRRTVSCAEHQHFETPSVVLTSLPRSPQPGEVCRVGETVFGFDGLEWARIEPPVEEGL